MSDVNSVELVEKILDSMREVYDPELGVNIVDLGLVYRVEAADGKADIRMTLTTPGCPMHDTLVGGVKWALSQLPEIREVEVEVVWEPQWSPEMMTDSAKEELNYL